MMQSSVFYRNGDFDGPNVLISNKVPDFMRQWCAERPLCKNGQPPGHFRMSLNGPLSSFHA